MYSVTILKNSSNANAGDSPRQFYEFSGASTFASLTDSNHSNLTIKMHSSNANAGDRIRTCVSTKLQPFLDHP
jgi:hypothetical protein